MDTNIVYAHPLQTITRTFSQKGGFLLVEISFAKTKRDRKIVVTTVRKRTERGYNFIILFF